MHPIVKNVLGIVAGAIIGAVVNMALIIIGPMIIPTPEGLRAGIHLFEPKHFIFPFLAHALGTLVGALIAMAIADAKVRTAYVIGVLFLIGGIANAFSIPAPTWFIVLDLIVAYIPMAYLATKLKKV